ncbi:T9SS type A sorting domain-containing protein [bacterium]|nr:T9SS type A sorting domain-containing protein [bacterium]
MMISRFLRSVLITLAVVVTATIAPAAWLGTGPEAAPDVTVRDASVGRTVIDVTLSGVQTDIVSIDGRDHAKIVLPGHVQLLERGAPQLPYVTKSVIIPDEGTPAVKVTDAVWREYPTAPIVPAKGPIPRSVDPKTVPYEFGPAYDGGVFPAEIATVSEPYIVRDHRGTNLRLFPLQWDADRGVLRVLERVTLEVTTSGRGGVNVNRPSMAPANRVFEALYAQQFLNHDDLAKYTVPAEDGPMLVVCYDAFMGPMQPFVDWKRERGLDVEMISTSSVGGTATGIKNAIQERYDSPEGLVFVVLVGDGQQLPSYSGAYEGANDDTRFVRLDGTDVYPDALISRISAQNTTQVQTQITKIITYERDITGPADWTHMAAGVASNEGSPTDATRMDWIREDLLGYTFTDVDRIYQGQGGTTSQITAAVNEGRSVVNYLGHGSGTAWTSVYFNNSNVHALTNTAWPWIIDVACLNGGIGAIGESYDEAWMRAGSPDQPHGAIGVYGSSTSCSWVPPTVMQAESIDLLVAETSNVLGVLMHAGIMQVLDEYGTSGVGLQMVEQYNLFGDCSLVVRTDSPNQMSVAHQPVVPLMTPTFAVDTGVAGVTVTLSGNGVIYGTGVTDASGSVELVMSHPVDTIGEATLTVFGYNQETYQSTLQVVVPADIAIEPATVPVGETTTVTVTVTDPDTGEGMDDVMVDIVGFGFTAEPVQTDVEGRVSFEVTPEFGETLAVRGQEIGTTYYMFDEGLAVTGAMSMGEVTFAASVPSIGMDGTLTPHIEGQVTATSRNQGFDLHLQGGGVAMVESTTGGELTVAVTPTELSDVTATVTKTGYDIVQQTITVVEAFGELAGTVRDGDDGDAPLASARVVGYPEGADPDGATPLFDLTTDAEGRFAAPEELPVGYYDLYVTKFGYLPYQETYFLLFGANDHEIVVAQAPSGVLTGFVTAADSGDPLQATVRVYRVDNDELFDETATDAGGEYTTGALPFFDYRVDVRASGRIPQSTEVAVDAAEVLADFALEPTAGNILVLDDNSSAARRVAAKYDDAGNLLAPAYTAPADRAAADLVADLETLGYSVILENAALSDPDSWTLYDMLLVTSGANTSPLGNSGLRDALAAFKADGGRLLVEGGEIAYDLNWSDPSFLENTLHVTGWSGDSSGDMTVAEPEHPVMSEPNLITGPISNDYTGYGDADRAPVAADAVMTGAWTNYGSLASAICYDDDDNPISGQFIFFLFNYSAMGSERTELLENAIIWLLASQTDPTAVEDEAPVLPRVVALDGNYPNPFNPQTIIRFALPSAQDVELAVYDVRGQRIRTLVRDVVPAGRHEVVWQGRDDGGRQVASGTYFYRLTSDEGTQVRKMLLVK